MIKATYYIGTYDKNTCQKELTNSEIINIFDNLFKNYTLQYANGVYTMQNTKTTIKEQTFIVTTFNEITEIDMDIIENNCNILKKELNQESILVEVSYPDTYFI